jgi:hypothetical protein
MYVTVQSRLLLEKGRVFPQVHKKFRVFYKKPNVQCQIQNNLPLDPISRHINPLHILISYVFKTNLNLFSYQTSVLQIVSYIQVFRLKFCVPFLLFAMLAANTA